MRIITLGTGAGRPTLRRASSATGLEYQGHTFLFDCGEGTQIQLMKTPFHWGKLQAIFISHLHGDHVNGLPGLLGTLSLSDRQEPLTVFGPVGLKKLLQVHQDCQTLGLRFELTIHEIETPQSLMQNGDYEIDTLPLDHVIPCWGYRFRESPLPGRFDAAKAQAAGIPPGPLRAELVAGRDITMPDGRSFASSDFVGPRRSGRSFVHCLDTKPCEAAVTLARDTDLLLYEATFCGEGGERAHEWGHSTARDGAEIAKAAGVGELVLTHISQRYGDPRELLSEAETVFPKVRVASDLDIFEVRHRETPEE